MAKVVKNLSKIQVNTKNTEYELILPKTDSSGNLENVAYINTTNTFQKPQEFALEATSNYESTELKGKSTKYDRASGTFTSGTENTIMLTSLYDKNNKLLADSTLQISGDKTLSYLEVLDKSGSAATLGIAFNSSTGKFETFAPETTEDSPSNSIVTKGYLDNFVPTGSGTVSIEDATNSVKGIVLLSDIAGTADAATGHTALTPKALQDTKTEINNSITIIKEVINNELGVDIDNPDGEGGDESGGSSSGSTSGGVSDTQKGTVLLSDAIDRLDLTATSGSTAATPKAVALVKGEIGNLSDLTTTAKDTIVAAINEVKSTGGSSSGGSGSEILPPEDTLEILAPSNISVLGGPDNVGKSPTVTCGKFTVIGSASTTEQHDMTDWVITKITDTDTAIWSSTDDSDNLTTIKIPKGKLEANNTYIINVRYHGNTLGWSKWSNTTFATLSKFSNANNIGIPGTANFGVGLAEESDYTSLGLIPCNNCETPNHFEYGLYTKTIEVSTPDTSGLSKLTVPCYFKFIPKFYIKYLQGSNGVNLSNEELDAILPYVDVTKEQMEEAQRRSPKNAMVIATADKFINKDEAQLQGFILPRGFIDGDIEKNGFFILNSLVSATGDGSKLTSLSLGIPENNNISTLVPLSLYNTGVCSKLISNMQGNSYDAINISKLVGIQYNCCSIFSWAIISLISLIQGQYATSTSECAWYDKTLTTNFPKGINSSAKDINDSSITVTIGSDTVISSKPNTIVNTEYTKTTHNGSITGITNVNGWLWQICTGFTHANSNYKMLNTSHKISEITSSNVITINDISLGSSLNSLGIYTNNKWGSTTLSVFTRDFSGNKWYLNGVYSFTNTTSGTNEFGVDYFYYSSYNSVSVGGDWSNGTDAGVFSRNCRNWGSSYYLWGFRIIAYPE